MMLGRIAIYERDGGICAFCNKHVELEDFEVDHRIPRALGGPHDDSNRRTAHRLCNKRAGHVTRMQINRGEALRGDGLLRMPGRISSENLARLRTLARSRHRTLPEQVEMLVALWLAAVEGNKVDFERERIEAAG